MVKHLLLTPGKLALFAGLVLGHLVFNGCALRHGTLARGAGETAVQSKATNFFNEAVLLKPAVESPPGALEPLIMQEVEPAEAKGSGKMPGTLFRSESGWRVAAGTASVYTNRDSVTMSGKPLPRHWFTWFYPDAHGESFIPRGVRVITDLAGNPIIWEVMSDASPPIVYVSESLEAKAAAEFGGPLPGRRYAVERSPKDAENTIVARVLKDGPVPMGPIVHVAAEELSITAVVCRCMPSQVRELVSTQTYVLLPWDAVASDKTFLAALGKSRSGRESIPPRSGESPRAPALRLPSELPGN